eukprot:1641049-Pleurochrysis_carterae.AAC.1
MLAAAKGYPQQHIALHPEAFNPEAPNAESPSPPGADGGWHPAAHGVGRLCTCSLLSPPPRADSERQRARRGDAAARRRLRRRRRRRRQSHASLTQVCQPSAEPARPRQQRAARVRTLADTVAAAHHQARRWRQRASRQPRQAR